MNQTAAVTWSCELRARVGEFVIEGRLAGGPRPLAIVGPNGAGKSTWLRTLVGAVRPEQGRIEVGDRTVFDATQGVDLAPRARGIGYVPQGLALFEHLNVLDNVAFGLRQGRELQGARALARAALNELELEALAERRPHSLSGGERQRVALARATVRKPALLLLDEPLAALDALARRSTRAWLAEHLQAQGTHAVIVTHDVRDVRALGADLAVLERGRVAQLGSLEDLSSGPATGFVAEFLGLDPVA